MREIKVGETVEYKVGRGWATGTVLDIYDDDGTVIIQGRNSKLLRRGSSVRHPLAQPTCSAEVIGGE